MAAATTFVIMGATGDLSRRKLVPALFTLACKGRLPEDLRIVGFARSDYSDDRFRDLMWQGMREFSDLAVRRDEWDRFARNLYFVEGELTAVDDFSRLKGRLGELEGRCGPANRLFYLSISPALYEDTVTNLGASDLAVQDGAWSRVVIEKPYGRDLASARALNKVVHRVFDESRVFRIDHYLGKETVQNLQVFRFANAIFEPLWNRNYIDNVQVTVAESVPVGDRGGYYDRSGVVRDMVQNHLLQLMTLVAMEPPSVADSESLRNKKVEVLRSVRGWSPDEVSMAYVPGQYDGYLDENGVPANSKTPTYAAVRLFVDNWRWGGVPFYLRTGKAMAEKASEIVIQFRYPPHMMFAVGPCQELSQNVLSLCIQPDEGIHLRFGAKAPGQGMCMRQVNMEFHYESAFKGQSIPEAYERLLEDALEGDPSLFIRNDHIEEGWKIVDPLLNITDEMPGPRLHPYVPGSWGPAAADALLSQDGREWLRGCGAHPE